MSKRAKIALTIVVSVLGVLGGTALALSNISLVTGTVASFDFGNLGPGYPVPATVQIHEFTMKPGDAVPWHYHKATSYVIVARGTLTEQHVTGINSCASEVVTAGSAFVESPGEVHTVVNTGNDAAVIVWATAFPQSDGIVQFTPAFQAGGVYPPAAVPACN